MGTAAGADLRVHVQSGASFDVDVDGATTVADVLLKINMAATAAGIPLTASLASAGNGIVLTDGTAGAGTLSVEALNYSTAATDLGLNATAVGGTLQGRDVSGVEPDGIFRTLEDLSRALSADDTTGIGRAGEQLTALLKGAGSLQGQAASLGQAIQSQKSRSDDAETTTKSLLSDIQDADYTEVATRYTQAQTVLQANLMSGSKLLQLSLLDFLQ